jgi:hypothetical protein
MRKKKLFNAWQAFSIREEAYDMLGAGLWEEMNLAGTCDSFIRVRIVVRTIGGYNRTKVAQLQAEIPNIALPMMAKLLRGGNQQICNEKHTKSAVTSSTKDVDDV